MRKEDFHSQLLAATFSALRYGQTHVKNRLPINVTYIVILNQSYDVNRKSDEIVYPEDAGRIETYLSDKAVVDLLYREGRCPQWIDISVAGADRNITLIRMLCCGRYHGDESRMYYYDGGLQPFGIISPDLPVDWKAGEKFRLKKPDDVISNIIAHRELFKSWLAD